jgi:hypothetical protein
LEAIKETGRRISDKIWRGVRMKSERKVIEVIAYI